MRLSSTSNRRRGRSVNARGLSLCLCLSLLLAAMPAGTRGQEGSDGANDAASWPATRGAKGARFVPGEALVRFRGEAAAESAERLGAEIVVEDQIGAVSRGRARARVERFGGEGIVPGLRLARVDAARTLEAIAALNARPDVLYAEPNFRRYLMATPDDPRFPELWGLRNTGQSGGTADTDIDADIAWDTTTGSDSVVVGVVDEGIDINHPDLAPNIWVNAADPVGDSNGDGNPDDDNNGRIDDTNGWDFINNNRTVFDGGPGVPNTDLHGTHVSGTIGARGNNTLGVVGVNWNVKLMSLKIFNPPGSANVTSTTAQLAAYAYAIAMRQKFVETGGAQGANVRVLNNSYGGGGFEQSELDAIRALNDAGIFFVASAGNDNRDNFTFQTFPANYDSPNVIAVAATTRTDGRSVFSSFSSRLVSIGAPGTDILSTTPNNTYSYLSGTSMSSPHVAGSAALLLSVAPDISVQNLRGALAFTGDRIPSLTSVTTTGRRLNVANALAAARENDTAAPAASSLSITSQTGRSVTLGWTAPGDDGAGGAPAADYDFVFVNGSTGQRTVLPSGLQPGAPGANESVVLDLPYLNFNGTIEMRAYDNRGNVGVSSIPVSVPVNRGSDPYIVSTSAAQSLSAGGTRLALDGDDRYLINQQINFSFPYFGQPGNTLVNISTNGVLYFSTLSFPSPPRRRNGDADDASSSVAGLQGQPMIAGLWDDIMITTADRPDAGVYFVQPNPTTAIFRWQGVTFAEPHQPVNFEIELRADGTIIKRYGDNLRVWPVVGIGGGEPSAYVVETHTREFDGVAPPISLTNAPTVTYAPRPAGPPPALFQFNFSALGFSEAAGRATIQIIRTGNRDVAASVSVRTLDNSAAVRCDDTTTVPGVAFARCDYATTVTTLNFPPNVNLLTFNVPLINDAHVEPNETVQLALFAPSANAELVTPNTMTLHIGSDDAAGAANPINDSSFFVRQQYLDFLSREPDAGGFGAWLGVLNNCANAYNTNPTSPAAGCDRNLVSSSFFRSAEFEIKGRYVFNFYTLSFGRLPLYAEIIPDMASVAGATEAEVYQKKAAFALNWVNSPAFQSAYGLLPNQAFVDTLLGRYSLAAVTTPDPATPDANQTITLTRADLVNRLGASTMTRAQVVRAIADSDEVSTAEFRRAFVAMQYFGYLRRDPEEPGYTNWLLYLNDNPNDFYTMVNGFANSGEYRLRFGPQ